MEAKDKIGKEMYTGLFDQESKANAFDQLASIFYYGNFGSAPKSEVDLMMFSIYLDAFIKKHQDTKGVLDYNAASDYNIGKYLGLPQERVRNLKVKKQARYPQEFDWRASLLSVSKSVYYDSDKNRLIIPLRDPTLYREIQNFVESHGGYIEIPCIANAMQLRPEHYLALIYEDLDETQKQQVDDALTRYAQSSDPHQVIPQQLTLPQKIRKIVPNCKKYAELFSCLPISLLPEPAATLLNVAFNAIQITCDQKRRETRYEK